MAHLDLELDSRLKTCSIPLKRSATKAAFVFCLESTSFVVNLGPPEDDAAGAVFEVFVDFIIFPAII